VSCGGSPFLAHSRSISGANDEHHIEMHPPDSV
jgi:hypothetical protein